MSTHLATLSRIASLAWSWWVSEIRQCLPRSLLQLLARRGPSLELRVLRGSVSLFDVSHEQARFAATVDKLQQLPSWMARPEIARLKRDGVQLCLGEGHHLLRTTALPRSALRSARSILELELSRLTPFRSEDVVSAWRLGETLDGGERAEVHHAIVKRKELSSWVERLRGMGLAVRQVTLDTEQGAWNDVNLLLDMKEPASRLDRWQARLTRVALAIVVTCLILVPMAISYRHAEASRQLDQEIEQHRSRALEVATRFKEIETSTETIARLGQRKSMSWPLVAVIDEVTRILPDDAWLSNLVVEGDAVSLSGHARSAASLLGLLESSDMFVEVRFTAPVYKDSADGAERFSMAMKLSARQTQAATSP